MNRKLLDEFKNPPVDYRGKPFWSWNGKLDREELLRQIHIMKEMGFGGFFMHSRTGLETEYLGELWFEHINACADEAEKLGMEAWLYDEDRWPSGIAGGRVTQNPEYRMKSIKLITMSAEELKWGKDVLAVFSCMLDGLSFYNCKRIDCFTPYETFKGTDILVFTIVEMSKHSFYNGNTYLDTLNRNATDKFIEFTHEKYKQRCADKFGKSIKGIFTDEPHRGTLMDSFGIGNEKDVWRAPWTHSLPENFAVKYGYDIVERLPELFLKLEGKEVSQVKWHYVELLQQMFLENFAKPIYKWCNKNNMILTGHVLHEDSLTAQTAMCGSVMRYYEYMGYPGVDILTENNRNFWVVKQLSSAARQLGKKKLLSELYGGTGWHMDFESHKAVGDWQALFGINFRCHHLSWYTMMGEAKRDLPASILHQSAWWKEYKHVEDYFSRIGLIMDQGKPCCDILVVSPLESVWCQIHPGWANMLEAKSLRIIELEQKYKDVFYWLCGGHIDFDYGDEDIISRHYCIEYNSAGKPILKIGEAKYEVVLVGGMITVRSTTLKILNEFINAEGIVIFAGDTPQYVDAVESTDAFMLAGRAVRVPFNKEDIIKAVKKHIDNPIEIIDSRGVNIDDIYCQMRVDGENRYIMFLNINREKAYKNVKIRISSNGFAEEWCCKTGERYLVAESDENDCIEINTTFEDGGEHIYVIVPILEDKIYNKHMLKEKEAYKIDGPYEYELDEPNVCVLDIAKYRLDNGEWQKEQEILKVDQDIRRKLGLVLRGGEMLQPWFAKKEEHIIHNYLSMQFDFYVKVIPKGIVELVLERPENFKVIINGHKLDSSLLNGWWIDKCFSRMPIPAGYIQKGKNLIELETAFHYKINLESLYLIGDFGVQINGSKKTLVKKNKTILASDLTVQGFPFYTGKVRYKINVNKINVNKIKKNGERVFISLDEFNAACLKITSKENKDRLIAWKPYEVDITDIIADNDEIVLEAILTRRNTFGPLHLVPVFVSAYGPEQFVTKGDDFSESYMLIPSGLLVEPTVKIYSTGG